MRLPPHALACLLCFASAACLPLMEEPVPPEEEYADALTYEEATATEANQQGVPPAPALEPQPEAWGPVYYPEPEESEGEGGAPPAVQIDRVEVVDPPPDRPEQLPSFD